MTSPRTGPERRFGAEPCFRCTRLTYHGTNLWNRDIVLCPACAWCRNVETSCRMGWARKLRPLAAWLVRTVDRWHDALVPR